jgi:hypothetical protein
MVRIAKKWDAEGNQLQPPLLQKGHEQEEDKEPQSPEASFELRAGESGLVVIKPLVCRPFTLPFLHADLTCLCVGCSKTCT